MSKRAVFFALLIVLSVACQAFPQESVIRNLVERLKSNDVETKLQAIISLEDLGRAAKSAVPDLAKALSDSNAKVRWHAARALGAMGPGAATAVSALAGRLKDEDPLVRAHAVRSLGLVGKASRKKRIIKQLVALIADSNVKVRGAVVKALLRIRPDRSITIPLFTNILEKAEPSVRNMVLRAMAEGGKEAIPALLEALERKESRYWACLILTEIGPDAAGAVPKLLKTTKDKDADVRMHAVMALGAIRPKEREAIEAIGDCLVDKEIRVRFSAAFALGNIGPDARLVGNQLVRQVRTGQNAFLRTTCVWALTRVYPNDPRMIERAVPILIAATTHKNPNNRAFAAKALGELKAQPEKSIPALIAALGDRETPVVSDAVGSLVAFGDKSVGLAADALKDGRLRLGAIFVLKGLREKAQSAVPALVATMSDEEKLDIRREIFFALAAIGPGSGEAIPHLIKALSHENPKVRNGASYALGKYGSKAQAALPALRENMKGGDAYSLLVSAWAIAQIDFENPETVRELLPVFTKGLEHEELLVRLESAKTLGLFGAKAKSAVSALVKALQDKERYVRDAAAAALKKIQP